MVPATKQEIFQAKTFLVAWSKSRTLSNIPAYFSLWYSVSNTILHSHPSNFSIHFMQLGTFPFYWDVSVLIGGRLSGWNLFFFSVWKAEEINVTFTKSILMVPCHLEYWYSRCPHQTTPIQLNWKLGFYRNIHHRTKRFFLLKIIFRLFICTIIICWQI